MSFSVIIGPSSRRALNLTSSSRPNAPKTSRHPTREAYHRGRPPRGLAIGPTQIDRHVSANFYPTPPEATLALLSVEQFDGPIWEPACGKGHIAKLLTGTGQRVLASDLNDWGYGFSEWNFLDADMPAIAKEFEIKHIVTNPPYGSGLADDFITQALAITSATGGKVAMLLNLSSLVLEHRTPFWRQNPPARLYGIDGVVCWPDPERGPPTHFLQQRYVWAVWQAGHCGAPTFWWLSAADFRAHADLD